MRLLIQKIKFRKLAFNFHYAKLISGASVIVVRYNEFFEKVDPFGIKLNTFNTKRLREGRSGLTFLRMLRRSAKEAYYKFTKKTEMQFNLFKNEHTDQKGYFLIKNNAPRFLIKELQICGLDNYLLSGFQGTIYKRSPYFHLYTFKLHRVRGWSNQSFSVQGFRNSFFINFQIKSKPYHNRLVTFSKIV